MAVTKYSGYQSLNINLGFFFREQFFSSEALKQRSPETIRSWFKLGKVEQSYSRRSIVFLEDLLC